MKIGVLLDHYFLPVRKAVVEAAKAGFEGVQLYTTAGDLAPENLSRSGERDLARLIAGHGLTLSALCGDLGGPRFADPATVDARVHRTCRILELAGRLGVPVVTAHVGTIPADRDAPARKLIREALDAVGAMADRTGVVFAVETGQEPADVLGGLLSEFNNPALGVNYDPANLLMNGFDPIGGVAEVCDRIVYVHAKDARRGPPGREAPLGEGEVDYRAFVAALVGAGYHGWHTVERKYSVNAVAELAAAGSYLRKVRSS
ncbi:MAG: hypothetical protein BIFFINMI_02511 [Phycisphaerae bacterium]|nr:hypothetical protein [Phycisphaerae bacterium]